MNILRSIYPRFQRLPKLLVQETIVLPFLVALISQSKPFVLIMKLDIDAACGCPHRRHHGRGFESVVIKRNFEPSTFRGF